LTHRAKRASSDPFLLVDRVIDMRGDEHGIGIKNLTMNEA